jgi:hypothetical protein
MKHRIAQLEARRQELLARIEAQRHELTWQAEQFRPTTHTVAAWARRRTSRSAANHPFAWLAGIASVLLMLKPPRRMISWLPWLAGTLSLLTRLARVIRLINDLRGVHSRYRADTP